jgi:hypothetical protein
MVLRSTLKIARQVSRKAIRPAMAVTAMRRSKENGSSQAPEMMAVTTMPAIIIIQTMVAAAGFRCRTVRLASSASSDVPAAPMPSPMQMKLTIASPIASQKCAPNSSVVAEAAVPASASSKMPPTIQGVRRPPRSEPWPQSGLEICTP